MTMHTPADAGTYTITRRGGRLILECRHGVTDLRVSPPSGGYEATAQANELIAAHGLRVRCWCTRVGMATTMGVVRVSP